MQQTQQHFSATEYELQQQQPQYLGKHDAAVKYMQQLGLHKQNIKVDSEIRPCLVADNVISDQNSSCGSPPLSIVVNGDEQHSSSTPVPTSTSVSRSKPQACRICGRVLASTSSYYVHLKSHSNNKPYRCTQCEACFCRKPYLEVHMRTHTGERPYQCNLCLKKFSQKSSLNIHKRVHTGERPYSCDICKKTFAVKSYVISHKWSHMTEKPFVCEQCQLSFNSKIQFVTHLRSHDLGPAHCCQFCGKAFVKGCFLVRHINKVHRFNVAAAAAATDHEPVHSSYMQSDTNYSSIRFDPREISILPTTKNGPRFLGPPPHNADGPPPLTHLTPMMLGPPQNTRA
ncbi:unnamed protein product [Macrosiphum euphorbiae]|jgi:hypothetical protein|uniref:C2H2-type domain-containing protein n=3 Tax=Aphidinae TaxID=133076 RepID=A0A8R1W377_ACYPI|nr:zinc finger protein 300 [Acyrthosiphon pisum]XP_022160529.1 zinc finger protein 300-like [Myzus persicae]XP_060876622.1 zinc finger protein 300-like [Metopolophium dirhodum]KAF0773233.1 zinc finger protein 300 [Aphis craccivora]CAI6363209.1 unnamed protein product [Macrosiphum euphorbiae]|eukprot:XP_001950590.1 PREDICTED: zinc finger protein 300 [Acyrthosiphon pisum]